MRKNSYLNTDQAMWELRTASQWGGVVAILWFGVQCILARDAGLNAAHLAAVNHQPMTWTATGELIERILSECFAGSMLLGGIVFCTVLIWQERVRKTTPDYPVSRIQANLTRYLRGLLGVALAGCLVVIAYFLADPQYYGLAIGALLIAVLAYLTWRIAIRDAGQAVPPHDSDSIITGRLLAILVVLLLFQYTWKIEGHRVLLLTLTLVAAYAWLVGAWLSKTLPLWHRYRILEAAKGADPALAARIGDTWYAIAYEELQTGFIDTALSEKIWAEMEAVNRDDLNEFEIRYISGRVEQLAAGGVDPFAMRRRPERRGLLTTLRSALRTYYRKAEAADQPPEESRWPKLAAPVAIILLLGVAAWLIVHPPGVAWSSLWNPPPPFSGLP